MKFYNPRLATITFGVSVFKGTVQIAIAKTLNPNFQGHPAKGQKIYDWENTVFFSLSPEECYRVMSSIDNIVHGTYENPKEKNSKFTKVFSITHFQNEQPSRLILDGTKDNAGNPTGSIVLTIIPPQGKGQTSSYVCRPDEFKRVHLYIGNGAKYLDFIKDVYDGIERMNNFKAKDASDNNSSQSSNQYANQSAKRPNNYKNNVNNNQVVPVNNWDEPPVNKQQPSGQQQTPPSGDVLGTMDDFQLEL